MSTPWQSFVARAIEGSPDDPFVRLLKSRLASGYEIRRVNLTQTPKGAVYVFLLSHLQQLSKMEVPHSPSFTRWSLANGVRMASREEEERRWAMLAAERFEPVAEELGARYANVILLERLRALGPPRTVAALTEERAKATELGREQARAIRMVDGFVGALAEDIGGALRYSAEETAEIVDGALAGFALARLAPSQEQIAAMARELRLGPRGAAGFRRGGR